MDYTILGDQVFDQAIDETSATQVAPLGTKVNAITNASYAEFEYIYALGAADTVLGSSVFIDTITFQSGLAIGAASGIAATAMSANVAGQYGWYRIQPSVSGNVNIATATYTVKSSDDGKLLILNKADGSAVQLPAAVGSGRKFRFFVGTTITSNSTTIKVANSSDTLVGGALVLQDAGSTVAGFEASGTDDTITLNGSTTGGIKGDYFEVEDVLPNLFKVQTLQSGTGTEATPFSATV